MLHVFIGLVAVIIGLMIIVYGPSEALTQEAPKPEGSIPCLRERNTLRYAIREVREARNAIEMGGAALLVEIDRLTAENTALRAQLPKGEEKEKK